MAPCSEACQAEHPTEVVQGDKVGGRVYVQACGRIWRRLLTKWYLGAFAEEWWAPQPQLPQVGPVPPAWGSWHQAPLLPCRHGGWRGEGERGA